MPQQLPVLIATMALDDFLGRDDTDPLLFDDQLAPKPAYGAAKAAIARGAD